jgi:hypothetical protein
MQLQKYRDACAKARLAMEPMKDPHRKLTDSETRAVVAKVDEILGIKPLRVLSQEYNGRLKTEGAREQLSVVSSQSSAVP